MRAEGKEKASGVACVLRENVIRLDEKGTQLIVGIVRSIFKIIKWIPFVFDLFYFPEYLKFPLLPNCHGYSGTVHGSSQCWQRTFLPARFSLTVFFSLQLGQMNRIEPTLVTWPGCS
jgi:hypothetical protein